MNTNSANNKNGHHLSNGDSGDNTTNNNSTTNNNNLNNQHLNDSTTNGGVGGGGGGGGGGGTNSRRVTNTSVVIMNGGSWRNSSTSAAMARANSFRHGGRNQSKSVSRKITKMLILVSSIFLLLNFPIHSFNVYIHCRYLYGNDDKYSVYERNTREIFDLLFYTSFSCNFLLYSISGVTFRSEFKRLLFKILRIKVQAKR